MSESKKLEQIATELGRLCVIPIVLPEIMALNNSVQGLAALIASLADQIAALEKTVLELIDRQDAADALTSGVPSRTAPASRRAPAASAPATSAPATSAPATSATGDMPTAGDVALPRVPKVADSKSANTFLMNAFASDELRKVLFTADDIAAGEAALAVAPPAKPLARGSVQYWGACGSALWSASDEPTRDRFRQMLKQYREKTAVIAPPLQVEGGLGDPAL